MFWVAPIPQTYSSFAFPKLTLLAHGYLDTSESERSLQDRLHSLCDTKMQHSRVRQLSELREVAGYTSQEDWLMLGCAAFATLVR